MRNKRLEISETFQGYGAFLRCSARSPAAKAARRRSPEAPRQVSVSASLGVDAETPEQGLRRDLQTPQVHPLQLADRLPDTSEIVDLLRMQTAARGTGRLPLEST